VGRQRERTSESEAWAGLDEEPELDGPVSNEALLIELHRARLAYRELHQRLRGSRVATWAWRGLAVAFVILAVALFIDDRADDSRFQDISRSLFITNCESTNDNRSAMNLAEIATAERLGRFALELGTDATLISEYVEETIAATNERPLRDCGREYRELQAEAG
jgi:hypothetical protein